MAELYSATTPLELTVVGGTSVPAEQYKRIEGQSPELGDALSKLLVASQAFAESYITDPSLRIKYHQKIKAAADEIMDKVRRGDITPHEGAQTANALRNTIMEWTRNKSTMIGKSAAVDMKSTGRTLEELQDDRALRLFLRPFDQLTQDQRNQVWTKIVESSGRSNLKADVRVRFYGRAGKTFLVMSLAIAAYSIYTSDDKPREAAKQSSELGASILSGVVTAAAIGAIVESAPGLVVAMSVFVAGVLAVEAVSDLFDYFWPERGSSK